MKPMTLLLSLLTVVTLSGQNRVLSLNGSNSYISLPSTIVDGDDFSIEAWYLVSAEGGGLEEQNFIFAQRAENTGCDNSAVTLCARARPDLPDRSFSVRTDQSCAERAASPSQAMGEWHHIAGVKSQHQIQLYIDGELMETTAISQTGSYATNISTVEIGRHRHDFSNFGFFNGLIDELRIWDVALTSDQINARMNTVLSGNEVDLLAYWNFDDGTADDQSDHGHNGSFMGNATTFECDRSNGQAPTLWGDLNMDGQVTIADVIVLVNAILD